jgi:hypothetical protein
MSFLLVFFHHLPKNKKSRSRGSLNKGEVVIARHEAILHLVIPPPFLFIPNRTLSKVNTSKIPVIQ